MLFTNCNSVNLLFASLITPYEPTAFTFFADAPFECEEESSDASSLSMLVFFFLRFNLCSCSGAVTQQMIQSLFLLSPHSAGSDRTEA